MIKHKYQIEYENTSGLFWDNKPAKYVLKFTNDVCQNLENMAVLDLGAGEGKNAVYLANKGAIVTAVDISSIALSKFHLQPNYEKCKDRIDIINTDIRDVQFNSSAFELVIAYGILHCLADSHEVVKAINRIKRWVKPGGYVVITTFTSEIPPPTFQEYLEIESFLDVGQLQKSFSDWCILAAENDTITETHPTSNIEHQHSLTRLIAQKNHVQ